MADENHSDAEARVRRLLRMAIDLESKPATVRVLARRLDVSEEQIIRDLETLRGAGVSIERISAGSYHAQLRPLPPAALTVTQAAQALDLSTSVIYHELWRGRLAGTKGRGNHWKITREAVEAYRRDHRYEPARRRDGKLTPELVREIRRRHAGGETVKALAEAYDIALSPMYQIVKGIRWAGVE